MRRFLSIISNNLLVLRYKPIVSAQPRVQRPCRAAISVRLRGFVQLYARRIVYAVPVKKNVEEKRISLQECPIRHPGPRDVPRVEQRSASIPRRSSRVLPCLDCYSFFMGDHTLFSPFLFHSIKGAVAQCMPIRRDWEKARFRVYKTRNAGHNSWPASGFSGVRCKILHFATHPVATIGDNVRRQGRPCHRNAPGCSCGWRRKS